MTVDPETGFFSLHPLVTNHYNAALLPSLHIQPTPQLQTREQLCCTTRKKRTRERERERKRRSLVLHHTNLCLPRSAFNRNHYKASTLLCSSSDGNGDGPATARATAAAADVQALLPDMQEGVWLRARPRGPHARSRDRRRLRGRR